MELLDARVLVFGCGITGQSCADYLVACGAQVVTYDDRGHQLSAHPSISSGQLQTAHPNRFDAICLSPGVDPKHPLLARFIAAGAPLINDISLFFTALEQAPEQTQRPRICAITGSNGKTTVTTWLTRLLSKLGFQVFMAGNVGVPVLQILPQLMCDAKPSGKIQTVVVLELSSFQLEIADAVRTDVAAILNITPDHLDRHGSFAAYQQAKLNLFAHASCRVYPWPNDFVQEQATCDPLISDHCFSTEQPIGINGHHFWLAHTQLMYQCPEQQPMNLGSIDPRLISGKVEQLNLLAVFAMAAKLVPVAELVDVINRHGGELFAALPHRFESLVCASGLIGINDSKATNVGATLAALASLSSFEQSPKTLLVGGVSKGQDVTPLFDMIGQSVDGVIAFGQDAKQFLGCHRHFQLAETLSAALEIACAEHRGRGVILLSPACASYDQYPHYMARGDAFKQELAAREQAVEPGPGTDLGTDRGIGNLGRGAMTDA